MNAFWRRVDRWLFAPVPAARLGAVRALVCAVALYDLWLYGGLVLTDAHAVTAGGPRRPWTPLYFVQVLGIEPIGEPTARTLLTIGTIALTAGVLGICSRVSCAVGAVVFFWWTGLAYSFGKPHHDKVALAFALGALPFARVGAGLAVDAWLARRWRTRRGVAPAPAPMVTGTPIWLTQLTLALGYCGAGTAKLALGGPQWFNGYTLQGIMLGHDGEWSRTFARSVTLAQLQSVGVVAVQALFPLVLVWPRTRWFFLPAATAFHLLTWKTMDTGPYLRVWLLLWVFVPLERVPATLRAWIRTAPLRTCALLLAGLAYAWLVASVLDDVLPAWSLLAAGALLLVVCARASVAAAPRGALDNVARAGYDSPP